MTDAGAAERGAGASAAPPPGGRAAEPRLSLMGTVVASVVASTGAAIATQPFDVVRTRVQLAAPSLADAASASAAAAAGATAEAAALARGDTPAAAARVARVAARRAAAEATRAARGASARAGPVLVSLLTDPAHGPPWSRVATLFSGLAPRAAKRTLQTALIWTLYEELRPRLAAL